MRREDGLGVELALGLLVAFGVLAYGSTSYWASALLQAAIAALFVAWWFSAARSRLPAEFEPRSQVPGREIGGVRFRSSGLGIPAALFGLLVVVQLIPLPAGLRHLLAPALAKRERLAEAVLESAAEVSLWRPLSIMPGATLDGLWRFVAYAALFLVVYNLVDSRTRLLRMTRALVAFAFFVAFVGLIQDLSGVERVYGLKSLRYGGAPYGPYVNHNHFAGFMEMTIPLTFALLLRRILRPSSGGHSTRITSGGVALPDGDQPRGERAGQAILLTLALAVMGSALLLSLSRGGLIALALATGTVTVLLVVRGKLGRWQVAVVGLLVAVSVATFLWIGPNSVVNHFRKAESVQNEPSFWTRLLVWRASLGIVQDFPVAGTGLGTYATAFLPYYPVGTEKTWKQAHNDYVQLLGEVGLAGGLVAGAGLVILLIRLGGPIVGRQEVKERLIYYGLCTGVLSLLLHSLVDFNLRVPGNAALFVVLMAMALAQRTALQRRRRGGS
jgi:O-antigen ligase